jgi:DedD protein
MSSLFEDGDREEPKSDADLTLGIGSLLSIFFGIVLICGIFFGFGYSMGRRNARATAAPPATPAPAQTASTPSLQPNELSGAPLKPAQPDTDTAVPSDENKPAETPAPSTGSHPAQNDETADNSAKAAAPSKPSRTAAASTSSPSLTPVPAAHRPPTPAKPHASINAPLAQAPGDSPIVPGHPIMVQIAAISRQEDAEVLASALRKRGFNPSVRQGTTDKLFHVQVGPFTDKAQAETMKQHLLADGYNAIMR